MEMNHVSTLNSFFHTEALCVVKYVYANLTPFLVSIAGSLNAKFAFSPS